PPSERGTLSAPPGSATRRSGSTVSASRARSWALPPTRRGPTCPGSRLSCGMVDGSIRRRPDRECAGRRVVRLHRPGVDLVIPAVDLELTCPHLLLHRGVR